jgi:hypothetical protein
VDVEVGDDFHGFLAYHKLWWDARNCKFGGQGKAPHSHLLSATVKGADAKKSEQLVLSLTLIAISV